MAARSPGARKLIVASLVGVVAVAAWFTPAAWQDSGAFALVLFGVPLACAAIVLWAESVSATMLAPAVVAVLGAVAVGWSLLTGLGVGLGSLLQSLLLRRTLDVACGSGYLTRHLRGSVVGLDRSPAMAALTRTHLDGGRAIVGDALTLPFPDAAFQRLFVGHFYGHLPPDERAAFLAEAGRVAGELVVIDSGHRPGVPPEEWQERVLNDGSWHRVFKRYLSPEQLATELGGEVLMTGTWFVAARSEFG